MNELEEKQVLITQLLKEAGFSGKVIIYMTALDSYMNKDFLLRLIVDSKLNIDFKHDKLRPSSDNAFESYCMNLNIKNSSITTLHEQIKTLIFPLQSREFVARCGSLVIESGQFTLISTQEEYKTEFLSIKS